MRCCFASASLSGGAVERVVHATQPLGDHVEHRPLDLQPAVDHQQRMAVQQRAVRLVHLRAQGDVDHAGLVLERDEHEVLGRHRVLHADRQPGQPDLGPIAQPGRIGHRDHPARRRAARGTARRRGGSGRRRCRGSRRPPSRPAVIGGREAPSARWASSVRPSAGCSGSASARVVRSCQRSSRRGASVQSKAPMLMSRSTTCSPRPVRATKSRTDAYGTDGALALEDLAARARRCPSPGAGRGGWRGVAVAVGRAACRAPRPTR